MNRAGVPRDDEAWRVSTQSAGKHGNLIAEADQRMHLKNRRVPARVGMAVSRSGDHLLLRLPYVTDTRVVCQGGEPNCLDHSRVTEGQFRNDSKLFQHCAPNLHVTRP